MKESRYQLGLVDCYHNIENLLKQNIDKLKVITN